MADAPFLVLDRLTKRFGGVTAVDSLSLGIPRGDILALLGPSGSGKTTTLRLLAGFERPDEGRITVGGEDVTDTPPAGRRFGMVFQHYALFPHLDVGRNIAFGLESQGVAPADRERRVMEALALVELSGLERRPVSALSGGQQQRVALARALAPEPRVLFLDEPLSNLDPGLRERTRRELRGLIHRIGITTILVTHEQEEAFDLADDVALLRRGRLEQLGTPEALYNDPATAFVAGFIGRVSVLPVKVIGLEETIARVEVPGASAPWEVSCPAAPTGPVQLHARPEALRMTKAGEQALRGEVVGRRFLGATALYAVRLPAGFTVEVAGEPGEARVGDPVGVAPNGKAGLHLLPGEAP
jgi:ABC-type Fe3+/spermidine/putrescine transport system ATPase subunit